MSKTECTCKGTGYTQSADGLYTECLCLKMKEVDRRLALLGLPIGQTFDATIDYVSGQQSQCLWRRFVEVLRGTKLPRRGMWLIGPTKSGKSTLMSVLAREAWLAGLQASYTNTEALTVAYFKLGQAAIIDACLKPDILLLDVGYEYNQAQALLGSLLYEIVWRRQLKGLPSILSTRCLLSELERRYGRQVLRELLDGRQILQIYTAPRGTTPGADDQL